jgi:hypothetical protein
MELRNPFPTFQHALELPLLFIPLATPICFERNWKSMDRVPMLSTLDGRVGRLEQVNACLSIRLVRVWMPF